MSYPIEQKYKWLLSQLHVTDIDLWEGDALIRLRGDCLYFQFPMGHLLNDNIDPGKTYDEVKSNLDRAVEAAMKCYKEAW